MAIECKALTGYQSFSNRVLANGFEWGGMATSLCSICTNKTSGLLKCATAGPLENVSGLAQLLPGVKMPLLRQCFGARTSRLPPLLSYVGNTPLPVVCGSSRR